MIQETEKIRDVQRAYDRVAEEYARRIYDELQHKPLDRQLLDRFAESVDNTGMACDLGCGPGQVARYLQACGIEVCGMDLSPAMIERARELNPEIEFNPGDMRALPVADHAWAGIAAFYAIVNLSPESLPTVFAEMQRVLAPGGWLLLAFHVGDQVIQEDQLWGFPISMKFRFLQSAAICPQLENAGLAMEEAIEREPYLDVEYPSRRAYIFARKPSS